MVSRFLLGHAGNVSLEELENKYGQLLTEDETFQTGYKVIRDTFIFTDKRLILIDVQGLTGKKQEYLSIPYNKITRYSVETAGHFDLDAELKLWIGSEDTPLKKSFTKKVDIYELQRILSSFVL